MVNGIEKIQGQIEPNTNYDVCKLNFLSNDIKNNSFMKLILILETIIVDALKNNQLHD